MMDVGQLMLRGTKYEDLLNGEYPLTLNELIMFMDGLDFVVEQWLASIMPHPHMDGDACDADATDILMAIIGCRYAIIDFLTSEEPEIDFFGVMKSIKNLKQQFITIAKPYLHRRFLSDWYLDLPIKVQMSFKHLHLIKIQEEREKQWHKNHSTLEK